MASVVITANRVADGGVVYLDSARQWTTRLASAATHATAKASEPELEWARMQEALVCDPHAIKVEDTVDGPAPIDAKQRIRAEGPRATLSALGFLLAEGDAAPVHRAEVEG